MPTETQQPLPGTRPEGAASEREARQYVRRMFSEIAGRYDLLNHLLTGNLDRLWRRRAARAFDHILRLPHARALDICCGTGDLALALKRQATHSCSTGAAVFGGDFSHPMLVRATEKSRAAAVPRDARTGEIGWFEADALALPLARSSFDLITLAFGFRNLTNYAAGLREFFQLLRPGGELGILECADPRGPLFGPVYRFYFAKILPLIGGTISGSAAAYTYLPASVGKFPEPDTLARMMSDAGFAAVSYQLWVGGAIALHTGKRPAHS
jgi:demethylmenaquinone methyltransferase / 2-methoxy-6-polyprenyl-1,4-benzoquinol methylase